MASDPDTAPSERAPGGRAWLRPVALVVSCLVIGFIAGWVLRGDDGPATVLAPPAPEASGGGAATTGGSTTAPPASTTAPATTTAPAEQAAPPARDEIRLAVLNATDVQGAAGRTADEAESLGYTGVTAGNAPTTTDPSTVYYREGQQAAADRVAADLQVAQVSALPASGGLATAAPPGAQVVLVIGPG